MNDRSSRLEQLSPAKRALLEKLSARGAAGTRAADRIRPREGSGPVPLSFGQRRLWFLERLQPGTALYTIPVAYRLRGRLDACALEGAFGEVVARHEALRTVFREVDGEPAQVVLPPSPPVLATADLRGVPAAEADRAVREWLRIPFDLARGPLVRAFAARTGREEWILAFAVHHAASDGWSQGIFSRELAAAYAARTGAAAAPLPAPGLQYPDYAAWQRGAEHAPVLDEQLAWWTARLAEPAPALELPADRPRPPAMSHRGAKRTATLPAELGAAAAELARAEGATPFMVLFAALGALLGRLSGEDEVRVGTPVANRGRPETEGTIGFFVNTLVLRARMEGDPTFRELLGRVREETLGAFARPDLPFERLVEALHPERSLGRAPLFQVLFALQDGVAEAPALPGCEAEELAPDLGVATLDLELHVRRTARGLEAMARFSTDLFDLPTVARMLERWERLLRGALADPDARVSALPLLDAEERRRVLETWNATERAYPRGACVHDLFAAQAARTPDAVALRWRGEATTYAELDRRSARLAYALRRRGVGPEARVGVCMRRTPELPVAMLGVLRAGGAYVPMDPAYPPARLGFMVEDAGIRLVLAETATLGALPAGVEALALDAERDAIAREPERAPESGALPENVSHVIFTSGSTGRPKGVMIRHSSTVVLLHWLREVVSDGERACALWSTSVNFDVSVAEVFGTLCWGGTLVLVENALELAEVAEPVVHASMVPGAAAELLHSGGIPATVRTLNLGGEALPAPLARGLYALGHVERVGNLYGPTEDTSYSTYALVERGADQVSIGRPKANSRAYVLDRHLQPVPPGVAGELFLAGEGLARGYAGRPELTAERFLPDPLGPAGSRMYRTLDRARWRPDGELEYAGRADFQVKLRGFRVELGEVEAALLAHPAVRAAVAVVRGAAGAPGGEALVAYVVADGPAPPAAELRDWARRTLPEYMVPAAVVTLDALPLTPNGKTDRAALPAPEWERAAEHVPPRTPEEALVAGILAELLGVERVGATDDFFALGGHSLLAARLASRVRAATAAELPLRAVFEDPTVAGLARRLAGAGGAGEAPAPQPLPAGEAPPLSFAQERLWLVDRLHPGDAAYHLPYLARVRGALDAGALRRALAGVLERHDALRTVFREVDGEAVQGVAPPPPAPLPVVDLAGPDAAARERAVRSLAAAEAARPFDLGRGPLLRAALLRLGAEEHALLLVLHHAVTDGWSMRVLFRDLSALYAAEAGGGDAALPPLPLQYADYAVWQRRRLDGEALERELDWWRERLAGAPALLELPTDRPRSAARERRGGRLRFELPAAVSAALHELARAEGATPFMTLLAGFQLLLARWSGQDEVVVGTPVAGRTHAELEELVGFFVGTLAVRTGLGGDPAFRELLARTRGAVLAAFEHQEVPFERLVEALHPERSLSHTPVFQAMFTLDDGSGGSLDLPGAGVEVEELWTGRAKFDVSMALRGGSGGLAGTLVYDADLFDRETAERMASHFAIVLAEAAAAPGARLSEIPMMDAAERRRVLVEWNRTARDLPPCTAHALFERQAALTPDAVAVEAGAERLTYAELDAASARIARALRAMGAGPETRVAVCLEPSAGMAAAVLGVLRAGAAYLPLDPAYPEERLRLVLEDAGARLLVSREALAAKLPVEGMEALLLDRDAARLAALDGGPVDGGAGPESLAYVIYTSGSTGRPKGVLVEHRGLANLLRVSREEMGFGPGDVAPALASFAFDIWGWETLVPLVSGGTVRLVPRERVMDVGALLEECRDATALHAVPALMRQLAGAGPDALPAVRRLFVGGDLVPPELLAEMRAAFPRAEVRVLYGPTEGTVLAAAHAVGERLPDRPLLGRPLGNVRLYVLGRCGEPLPAGVPGELYIGGAGVARGYLGRPELTAEKWVPDPFGGEPGGRLYRTGDRARRLADGTLEFLGRTDFQVKIRGFRIEPGEVEGALLAHPAVRDAVVVVRASAAGEPGLVGYAVARPDAAPAAAELRAWLKARLPEHMVPSAVVVLDAFPLTAAGKTDRAALPAPEPAAAAGEAPRTPEEEIVAGILAEVLRVDRVGIHDDFFALGGHSLLATRVVSRVRALLGAELPLRAVFEAPTAAGLAERVGLHGGEAAPPVVPVPRDGRTALPLSFSQERLWFLDRMEPVNAHHNIAFAVRLEGVLDAGALQGALAEVVRRHESLRTVFGEEDGRPVQRVLPPGGFRLPRVDLGALPAAEREAALAVLARDELRRPTDLEAGPLARATLARLGPEDHALVLMIHHAVSDAWSFGVLYRELSAAYAARLRGEAAQLPPLPVQYADWAAWQRARLTGETLERQLAYWRERLEGAPALLELPTDRPRPALQTHRAATLDTAIPAELAARLRALDRREGVTPFMTFLAALCVLLRRRSGQEDVVVGTPIAGRTRAETEGLIGFFVNMLALRTDLSGEPTLRELLARVRETTLGAYAHQEVPFERLLEELGVQRSLAHASVYQVSLLLHNAEVEPPRLPGVRASVVPVPVQATPFDLSLVVADEGGGRLRASFTYNADLFDEATVASYGAQLLAILEEAAADPERPLSELAPVTDDERRVQLHAWNATDRALPADRPVAALLREAARRRPDAPAVVQEGAAPLTFVELERRAAALAARLAALGASPEARVAICLERSPEMLVALRAVLEAGACYVPVDPSYPADRIRYVLEDSGAAILLTQRRLLGTLPGFAGEAIVLDAEHGREALTPRPPLPMLGEGEHTEAGLLLRDAPPPERGRVASLSEPGGGLLGGATPHSAAYVVYTSGSTGRPKGVVVPQGALANYAAAAVELYGITPADRVLQFASLAFDASAEEIFPALLGGAALVLRTEEMLASPETFLERCAAWGVTVLDLPTAYWHELVAELERGTVRVPACVRLVIIGGERALPERVAAWRRRVGDGVRLVNTYGPTETTVVATLAELGGRAEPARLPEQPLPPAPIGGPVPNARAYVLDGAMRPLPVGARGELYVGGAGVARGYLGRPDLTAERFVPDPFSAEPGARLYRTGDVVRWRRDGELEFVGRADDQVKVRGFRVELGEVEDVLLRCPGVREAAVAAREDEPGRTRLVAYVVPDGEAPAAAELRSRLKADLPEYMVPAAFVVLDALPLTGSGKVDRRALPAPGAGSAAAAEYVAPRTEAEARVAEIWAEVLRAGRVGATDDFFALGGHSLLATQVVSRVRRDLGVALPLRAVFEHPTVAGLAALLPVAAPEPVPAPADEIVAAASGLEGELLDRIDELSDAEIERLLAGLSTDNPIGA